ncbi:MAG: molybdate ABC transporter substrate-binding protein [Desulfovibrionaceae bacterium]
MKSLRILFVLAVLCLMALPARAADLLLAQAANFTPAMEEIIPAFKAESGLTVEAVYTSTGKLYGQIMNGAPFDVFLAADQKRPAKLFADGQATEPFIYAKGQVVLFTMKKDLCAKSWDKIVADPAVAKVGIANVETAPYGTSSMQAMQAAGIWDSMQSKLVFGQNITQPFQFATTGAADASFIALSSTFTPEGAAGCFVQVPQAPDVIQAGCILKSAPHPENAAKFVKFLESDTVKAIKAKYGYK